jgi:hypothetical protein
LDVFGGNSFNSDERIRNPDAIMNTDEDLSVLIHNFLRWDIVWFRNRPSVAAIKG